MTAAQWKVISIRFLIELEVLPLQEVLIKNYLDNADPNLVFHERSMKSPMNDSDITIKYSARLAPSAPFW